MLCHKYEMLGRIYQLFCIPIGIAAIPPSFWNFLMIGASFKLCINGFNVNVTFTQQVRLKVWHFMRRLARGCTSESHPLCMAPLGVHSLPTYLNDFENLVSAKRAKLVQVGVSEPAPSSIRKAISKEELVNHCKRPSWATVRRLNRSRFAKKV